ncbi:MAG TPA: ATP-binding protein [Mycobacteriales bacterium]|nr:ATP-binding protein [Mycobacteriales bacterium]
MAVTAALVAGFVLGMAVTVFALRSRRSRPTDLPVVAEPHSPSLPDPLLQLLTSAVVQVDVNGDVRTANAAARSLGLVRGLRLCGDVLEHLTRDARLQQTELTRELTIEVGEPPRRAVKVRARARPMGDGRVGLVVDDLSEANRVENMRRDFVANVGHEIKTPVGALTLLAEAALDAADDPVATKRFLGRIQHEATRLARLVQELLDLSRVQGGEPLAADPVAVDGVIEEAVDRSHAAAEARQISIVRSGDAGVVVSGDGSQLVTALVNLLDNAVSYSHPATRITVTVHERDGWVDIAVKDEGIGIADSDRDRIFERFYRVDPARSRETGGTGLGLSIVKHVVSNHGGAVSVWSELGTGSTFTVSLPTSTRPSVSTGADSDPRPVGAASP